MAGLISVYEKLLRSFGKQDWWPTGKGFMPAEFEVCIGAILTQNTSWGNAEKALELMKSRGFTNPLAVSTACKEKLEQAIQPSGFYRQKAERLRVFSDFIIGFGGFRAFSKRVTRERLLGIKGIGPETADSILLYAFNQPNFVVDAYTKRVFTRLGICQRECCQKDNGKHIKHISGCDYLGQSSKRKQKNVKYDDWQYFFHSNLPKDTNMYKEFHALIVELAKRHCRAKPACEGCPLCKRCAMRI